jgi:cytochrome c-type biogenesis protein CcmH/NrfG
VAPRYRTRTCALAIDDRLIEAWRGLARTAEAEARWAEAGAAFDRIVALDPTDVSARIAAGVIHRLRLEDPGAAVVYFRDVLTREPDHYGARFQLALALFAAGDEVGARAEWRRFAALARTAGNASDLALAPAGLHE